MLDTPLLSRLWGSVKCWLRPRLQSELNLKRSLASKIKEGFCKLNKPKSGQPCRVIWSIMYHWFILPFFNFLFLSQSPPKRSWASSFAFSSLKTRSSSYVVKFAYGRHQASPDPLWNDCAHFSTNWGETRSKASRLNTQTQTCRQVRLLEQCD